MDGAKPYTSPVTSEPKLSAYEGDPFEDVTLYRQTVGALQYLSLTRPDITYSVNQVCQHMHTPRIPHWVAVKRILRYLKGTINHGLFLPANSSSSLVAYSDVDWAGNVNDKRSITGFCIYLGNSLISWAAKKQQAVSRSSTESEYRALAVTAAEVSWIRSLLKDLQVFIKDVPI
ncbi:uncharacterized mitochondrial protein AtMg00810-like [Telopea speciosissima]|uniref:uncharacterized mitochondrial protein AtMg00810-like n=1 Tax=Telopea speciosissima TaxID=54955 RepID=UPI001CC36C55|nr:uncharacterized mitochondrial protein AtMg00810-like [Telopea speciosissima]